MTSDEGRRPIRRALLVDVVHRMTRDGWTVTDRKVTLP